MASSGTARAALALAILLFPCPARAQTPAVPSVRSGLSLEIGFAHASVLDPVASPLRYTGGGAGAAIGYRRASARATLELGAEVQAERLLSRLSDPTGKPRETAAFGAVTTRALWRVAGAGGAAGPALLVGAEARLDVSARDHLYSEPALDFGYGLALAALGPAARLRLAAGRAGELSADAAAPLVGLALRPYGDLAYARSGLHPRVAAPPRLAGLDAGLTWAVPLGASRSRLLLAWRLDWLRYRDADLYLAARQRVGLGVELPLGGGA